MINKGLRKQEEQLPAAPGIGIAGKVICPILSIAGRDTICAKQGCEWWVELTYGAGTKDQRVVGRCAVAWGSVLQTEQTAVLQKMIMPTISKVKGSKK